MIVFDVPTVEPQSPSGPIWLIGPYAGVLISIQSPLASPTAAAITRYLGKPVAGPSGIVVSHSSISRGAFIGAIRNMPLATPRRLAYAIMADFKKREAK